MNEQELRGLVRQAIALHLAQREQAPRPSVQIATMPGAAHVSHGLFTLSADPAGACLIEPAVACDRCGFCKSYGH